MVQLIGEFVKNGVVVLRPTSCPVYINGTPPIKIVETEAANAPAFPLNSDQGEASQADSS